MQMSKMLLVVAGCVAMAAAGAWAADAPGGRGGGGGDGAARVAREAATKERIAKEGAAKAEREAAAKERQAKELAARGERQKNIEERVDKREANQEKRIEQGVKQGQLTPDEVALLQGQEKGIGDMETAFKGDGKITKEEGKKLRDALNAASVQIWAQRHDTEGNQKAVLRLGTDVFAKTELTAKLEAGELTKPEARKVMGDFHKLVTLKRRLGAENLSAEARAKAQAEYNALLNLYFVVK